MENTRMEITAMVNGIKNPKKKSDILRLITFDNLTFQNHDKPHTYYGVKSKPIMDLIFDAFRDKQKITVEIDETDTVISVVIINS